jgi:hypothetical protein
LLGVGTGKNETENNYLGITDKEPIYYTDDILECICDHEPPY